MQLEINDELGEMILRQILVRDCNSLVVDILHLRQKELDGDCEDFEKEDLSFWVSQLCSISAVLDYYFDQSWRNEVENYKLVNDRHP